MSRYRGHRCFPVLYEQGRHGFALEGQSPGQHLIEDDAQGVLVQPAIQPATFPLFGGHVMGSSHDAAGLTTGGGSQGPGDAEVGYLGCPVFGEKNILRFDVPMHYSVLVGVG